VYGQLLIRFPSPPAKPKQKTKAKAKPPTKKGAEMHFRSIAELLEVPPLDPPYVSPEPESVLSKLFAISKRKNPEITSESQARLAYPELLVPLVIPGKSAEFQQQAIRELQIAGDLLLLGVTKRMASGRFSCMVCDRRFEVFDSFASHCWSVHKPEELPDEVVPDPIRSFVNFLMGNRFVNFPFEYCFNPQSYRAAELNLHLDREEEEEDLEIPQLHPIEFDPDIGIKCNLCDSVYESTEDLRNHCWENHIQLFIDLFVNDRHKLDEEQRVEELGLICINQLRVGTVSGDPVTFGCAGCTQKPAAASKLFQHLFYKHLELAVVTHAEKERWPLTFGSLPVAMQTTVDTLFQKIPVNELKSAGLLGETAMNCVECEVTFADEEERRLHFLREHFAAIFVFRPSS
jgi:hypothetical protein